MTRDWEPPAFLEKKIPEKRLGGVLISAGPTLLLANLLDLTSICTIGSAGFLFMFAAVNWGNVRLGARTNRRWQNSATGTVPPVWEHCLPSAGNRQPPCEGWPLRLERASSSKPGVEA